MLEQIGRKLEVLPKTQHPKERNPQFKLILIFVPSPPINMYILAILLYFSITADGLYLYKCLYIYIHTQYTYHSPYIHIYKEGK